MQKRLLALLSLALPFTFMSARTAAEIVDIFMNAQANFKEASLVFDESSEGTYQCSVITPDNGIDPDRNLKFTLRKLSELWMLHSVDEGDGELVPLSADGLTFEIQDDDRQIVFRRFSATQFIVEDAESLDVGRVEGTIRVPTQWTPGYGVERYSICTKTDDANAE